MESDENKEEKKIAGKILVVDDEESIRRTLRGILERYNYDVDVAEKYSECKDKLFTENYDAMILDIILPEINGIEILHIINKANLNLPTIMLTGAPALKTAKESVKYGAFDYLTKPIDMQVLLNQVKNAVSKKRLIDTRNRLMEELKQKNKELEMLVEKRTQELRISEIRYRTVVESVQDIIIITDENGNITFCNVVFLDFLGEKEENQLHMNDILGKYIGEYIESLNNINIHEIVSKVKEGFEFDLYKCKFNNKFQSKEEYLCSVRGIFDENLNPQEIIFIIRTA
ncbi:MAG: response regulator [Promethearchaeota archaeon]